MVRAQTTKSVRIQFVSLILAALISLPAHAEVIPGRWEKVPALEMASPITVDLKNGNRIQGQFRGLSSSDLELMNSTGRAAIPRADIQNITLPFRDGLGDGAWKGAAIGAAAGSHWIRIAVGGGPWRSEDDSQMLVLVRLALAAGIGAGIGIAADAATKSEATMVYNAPGDPSTSIN